MSDTLIIALLTAGLIISVFVSAWQDDKIKKLKNKIKDLERKLPPIKQ
jgi:hypothetical protein